MIVPKIGCVTRMIVEVAFVVTVIAGFIVWQAQNDRAATGDVTPTPNTVLEKIHLAGELTTAVGCVQTVIKSSEVREMLQLQVGTAEILYVGVGQVRAGLNLMELDEKALTVDGDKVTVTLPPCEILDEKVDVLQSYVFDMKRSMVSPRALHLQSAAEKEALREIRQAAIQAGLLEQAEKQAKILLRYWFQSAGFRRVEFKENDSRAVAPAAVKAK